jgi:hypothetical protein
MDSEKTKRIYIAVFIIALLISLGLIFSFLIYPNFIQKEIITENNNVQDTVITPGIVNPESVAGEQQYDLVAGATLNDLENCQADPEGTFKRENVSSPRYVFFAGFLALAKKDLAVCAQTGSDKDNDGFTCAERYLLGTTLVDSNGNCANIVNKELSISCQAIQKKDVAMCAQISDVVKKATCEAIVIGDKAKCSGATAEQAGKCANTVSLVGALSGHELSLCEQISDSFQGGSLEKAYCKIALAQNSQKEWNAFYVNEVCLKNFINITGQGVSSCENIPNKETGNKSLYTDCLAQFE